MKVLGIDPGVGRLGWAIVEKEKGIETLLASGCLETPANSDINHRLVTIHKFLNDTIDKYKPDHASVEDLFFAKNAKTVMAVSAARGVILLTCTLKHLPTYSYTPLQIKSALTGFGKAEKSQVEFMVLKILKLDKVPNLDDTDDAIAAALTHFAHYRSVTITS